MPKTQAVFYRDKKGNEPVDAFIDGLQDKRAAKINQAIDKNLNGRDPDDPPPEFPATSQLDGELRELRVRFAGTRYRILYRRSKNLVVLLHAIEKDKGKVPTADIDKANARFKDFTKRMNAEKRERPRAAGRDAPPKTR